MRSSYSCSSWLRRSDSPTSLSALSAPISSDLRVNATKACVVSVCCFQRWKLTWLAAVIGVLCLSWSPVHGRYQAVTAEAQLLTALEDSRVQLSCDIRAPGPGDFPVRILWFKDLSPSPVYSVEVNSRTGSLSQVRQSAQLSGLQGRAYFSVIQVPAVLSIDGLRHSDNGTYVCAVDFKKDWTRKLTTHLIVIVPPKRPVILDENETRIENTTRPYREGEDITLTCDVYDGKPEPVVTWWRGSELLQQVLSRTPTGNPRATLFRLRLSRADYMARLTCRAVNSNISEPVSTSIIVNMNLKPLSVEIKGSRGPLSADLSAQVICQVNGSRPDALIRWFLGPYQLNETETHPMSANTTLGVLHFVPTDRDHGAKLRCVASNPMAGEGPTPPLEDSWSLDVHYKPVVQLRLGSGLNPASIHEGIDIYFECTVRANPGVSEVSWQFNRKDLHTDGGRGVIVSNQSLALRSVNRTNSGFYACLAANTEGEAESNRLKLRVLHAPACHSPQRQYSHAVAKHETVEVSCDVEADPQDVSFAWSFHQGHRNLKLASNAFSATTPNRDSNSARSVLLYTPKTDADYGSLFCLARNAVGESAEPCVFQVIPVGPPMTPFNCTVEEVTSESVHVTCQRSGPAQQQTFLLELHDGQSPPIATNFTSGQASFRVHSLRAATRYRLVLYGINANGRSEPVHMTFYTLPVERSLASQDAGWGLGSTTLWAAALSCIAAFLIVFIALTLGKFRRKILFNRSQEMWNRGERCPPDDSAKRDCNHVRHDLVEGNTDLGTELAAFDPPAMITFKDPIVMKPNLSGSNGAILVPAHPKMFIPSPS